MKFINLLLVLLTFSLSVQGQQKRSTAKVNASNIIRMGNSVIDLSNDAMLTIENYRSIIQTADNNQKRLSTNMNQTPHFVNYKIYSPNQRKNAEYTQATKLAPAFDEKADLIAAMTKANSDITTMVAKSEALSNYFSNKEYVSDANFAKYPALKEATVAAIEQAYTSWRVAARLAATAGDKAELLILKDSKIAEFIIPMKTDLVALKGLFVKIGEAQDDVSAIANDVAALKASIEKNKDVSTKDIKKLSGPYYKEVYETFYRKVSQSADRMDKVVDLLKNGEQDKTRLSSFFNSARSAYEDAVGQYNTFVSQ